MGQTMTKDAAEHDKYHRAYTELNKQIGKLATTITDLNIGEPSCDEGAVDTAIRLLKNAYGAGAAPAEVFKDGDTVQLKHGGCVMTVSGCASNSVATVWFDEKGSLHRDTFKMAMLRAVSVAPRRGPAD